MVLESRFLSISYHEEGAIKMSHPFRITVLSDTHMPRKAKELPASLLEDIRHSDLILHAGDWSNWELYEQLSQYATVEGVAGNVDDERIIERLGYKKLVEIEGKRIGMVHGHGQGGTTPSRARKAFADTEVDCILFGHSHIPFKEHVQGCCSSILVPPRIKAATRYSMEGCSSRTEYWRRIMFLRSEVSVFEGICKISKGLPAFEISRLRLINRSPRYGKSCG